MDEKANDLLAQLQEQMRQESLVKGIEDLQVGDIVYYDMDRADGIVPNLAQLHEHQPLVLSRGK